MLFAQGIFCLILQVFTRDIEIKLNHGNIIGKEINNDLIGTFDVFLGIPFAKPPIGNLRWAPPQDIGIWEQDI